MAALAATLATRVLRRVRRLSLEIARYLRIAHLQGFTHHRDVLTALMAITYYSEYMARLNNRIALFCDSMEAKRLIETGMRLGMISQETLVVCRDSSPPPASLRHMTYAEDWDKHTHALIVSRLLQTDDRVLRQLHTDLCERSPSLVLFDQVSIMGGTWRDKVPCQYLFRNLTFWLNPGTVIPSYYANNQYINYLLGLIHQLRFARMLDVLSLIHI